MAGSLWQVRDELWQVIEPLLPEHAADPRGGRPRVDDRVAFGAIVFVLFTGIAWRHRPPAPTGVATGGRLLKPAPRAPAPAERGWADRLVAGGDRRQLCARPARGGLTGPSPVDRARTGSKHHLMTDANGVPLAVSLTGAHRNDVTQLLPLVDGLEPVAGKLGRPRQRAERLLADRGYDHDKYRRELRARGVKPLIARRQTEHGSGLGKERWVVERGFAWLHNLRRLRTRYERLADLHLAFLELGCALVCQRMLNWHDQSSSVSRPY
jgi:transposase